MSCPVFFGCIFGTHLSGRINGRGFNWVRENEEAECTVGVWSGKDELQWISWSMCEESWQEFVWILSKGAGLRAVDWKEYKKWEESPSGMRWISLGRKFNGGRSGQPRAAMLKGKFDRLVRDLARTGWYIRKEDRGNRLILVRKSVEDEQVQVNLIEKRKMVETEESIESFFERKKSKAGKAADFGTVYTLPKTHKEELTARVVEACGRKGKLVWLEDYIRKKFPWDKKSVKDVFTDIEGWYESTDKQRMQLLRRSTDLLKCCGGDIEKLFPSIDVKEVRQFILEDFGRNRLLWFDRWMERSRVLWNNKVWKFTDGIPIGSTWSPQIARYYLGRKEQKVVRKYKGKICFVRYVDDVGTVGGKDLTTIAKFRKEYEAEIQPLKIKWDTDRIQVSCDLVGGRFGGKLAGTRILDRGRRPKVSYTSVDGEKYWASRVRSILDVHQKWEKAEVLLKYDGTISGQSMEWELKLKAFAALERLGNKPSNISADVRKVIQQTRGICEALGTNWNNVKKRVLRGLKPKNPKSWIVNLEVPWWFEQASGKLKRLCKEAVCELVYNANSEEILSGIRDMPTAENVQVRQLVRGVFKIDRLIYKYRNSKGN